MKQTRHMMAVLAMLGLSLLGSGSQAAAPKRQQGPVKNEAGQALRGADGQAIRYQRKDWRRSTSAAATPARVAASRAQEALAPTWSYVAFGANIGGQGLVSASVNGRTEVLATATTSVFGAGNYWYALGNASGVLSDGLGQSFASEQFAVPINRLALARAGGGAQQVVVALSDGTLVVYDLATKQVLQRSAGPCAGRGGQAGFATADLNADGVDEYVSLCGDQSLVAHGPTYTEWSLAGVGGSRIAVGQMDNDAAMEIATTAGKVVDAGTKSIQWTRAEGFGNQLLAGDIDADGRDELIAAEGWYWVHAYDVEKKLPKWSLQAELDIGAIQLADVTGDGVRELLLGDGQWGAVHAYDPTTLAELGSIGNPEHGVTNILVADVNGDGTAELMWGAGATSTGEDHLYVSTWSTKSIVWQNIDLTGPFVGPVTGDLDGDGAPEVVFGTWGSDADYSSGRIIVLDGKTLAVRGVSPPIVDNLSWTGMRDLRLAPIGAKGRLAILVAADRLYDGALEVYRFNKRNEFTRVTSIIDGNVSGFTAVAAADLDGDASVELLGAGSGFVHAYDPLTGSHKWRSPVYMGGSARDLIVADIDDEPSLEFTALAAGGKPYVHAGPTREVEAIIDLTATTMSSAMTPNGMHLLLGDSTGMVHEYAFQNGAYAPVRQFRAATGPLDGISVDQRGRLWVGTGGVVRAFDRHGALRYQSVHLGESIGRRVVRLAPLGLDLTAGGIGLYGLPSP
ncbi:MAG: FG-GAP repeat domain-containing protein [Pseudomonadota bacterium]